MQTSADASAKRSFMSWLQTQYEKATLKENGKLEVTLTFHGAAHTAPIELPAKVKVPVKRSRGWDGLTKDDFHQERIKLTPAQTAQLSQIYTALRESHRAMKNASDQAFVLVVDAARATTEKLQQSSKESQAFHVASAKYAVQEAAKLEVDNIAILQKLGINAPTFNTAAVQGALLGQRTPSTSAHSSPQSSGAHTPEEPAHFTQQQLPPAQQPAPVVPQAPVAVKVEPQPQLPPTQQPAQVVPVVAPVKKGKRAVKVQPTAGGTPPPSPLAQEMEDLHLGK